MTGAIFGLVGVIIGGLLTAAVETYRETRSQRALSRAAARLLSAELSVQQEILERRAEGDATAPADTGMPAIVDWPEQRVVMAKTLDDDTWIAVAGAYANLTVWHAECARGAAPPEALAGLPSQLHSARASLQAFRRPAGPSSP